MPSPQAVQDLYNAADALVMLPTHKLLAGKGWPVPQQLSRQEAAAACDTHSAKGCWCVVSATARLTAAVPAVLFCTGSSRPLNSSEVYGMTDQLLIAGIQGLSDWVTVSSLTQGGGRARKASKRAAQHITAQGGGLQGLPRLYAAQRCSFSVWRGPNKLAAKAASASTAPA